MSLADIIDRPWSMEKWILEVQKALNSSNRGYQGYKVARLDEGQALSHCQVVRAQIVRSSVSRTAFAKRHTGEVQVSEGVRPFTRDPYYLRGREVNNLDLIGRLVGRGLVPRIYGDSNDLIVMQYIPGQSAAQQLDHNYRRLQADPDNTRLIGHRNRILHNIVHAVARFAGLCNGKYDEFVKENPSYKIENDEGEGEQKPDSEKARLHRMNELVFKDELLLLVYKMNPGCISGEYKPAAVEAYLRGNGINLDDRLSQLFEIDKDCPGRLVLAHNDLSPIHIKSLNPERKGPLSGEYAVVLDLEKFGLGLDTEDISSALIYTKVGNNTIIQSREFPHLLDRYLALEFAYRTDPDLVERLRDNGDFGKFRTEEMKMSCEQYADFNLGFYDRGIRKNIHLGARPSAEGTYSDYVVELFDRIISEGFLDKSSKPASMGNKFYHLARLLIDLEYISYEKEKLDRLKAA